MDDGEWQIHNHGPEQGQIIGQYQQITQHFHNEGDEAIPAPSPEHIWHIPYGRNPFFTGRENLLKRLHDTLTATKAVALPQLIALCGLGGIGKTQTVVEYAYRYREDYQAILWAKATNRDTLVANFVILPVSSAGYSAIMAGCSFLMMLMIWESYVICCLLSTLGISSLLLVCSIPEGSLIELRWREWTRKRVPCYFCDVLAYLQQTNSCIKHQQSNNQRQRRLSLRSMVYLWLSIKLAPT